MPRRYGGIVQIERRRRRLPHWEASGETYFVTFRLQRPTALDLTNDAVAQSVVNALRFFDGKRYLLFDYTVMPDHVHVILKPLVVGGQSEPLWRITHSLKSWLAHRINEMRGRKGSVWQEESYDHMLRNREDYSEKAAYVYDNPRRKGLVDDPANWPWWGIGSAGR